MLATRSKAVGDTTTLFSRLALLLWCNDHRAENKTTGQIETEANLLDDSTNPEDNHVAG